jgi:hypothetical protein
MYTGHDELTGEESLAAERRRHKAPDENKWVHAGVAYIRNTVVH